MTLPAWQFRRMQPGEMNIDPIEAEFFSTEALGSLSDALVRESIQNSLDARRPGESLHVRVYFPGGEARLRDVRRARYLTALEPHLRASRSGLNTAALPAAEEPLSFLVIEDFGTRGLQGDPEQSEDAEVEQQNGMRNDFFYFWRNVGRSRKNASDLGRWGLGKTVFQAASRINSFFALTVRANDRRRLLLGQSVLKVHRIEGQRFYPYGYFGRFDQDLALPVESPETLATFEADFGVARGGHPGTSIVLPYPDQSLTPGAIIESVVRHYFMPILDGSLVVDVVDGERRDRLDAASLTQRFQSSDGGDAGGLSRVFDLARWAMSLQSEDHTPLGGTPETSAPRWDDALVPDTALASLRGAFQDGQAIAVTVPIWVKPESGTAAQSQFHIYLQRDETLERADEHFVRDGITVTGVRSGLPKGVRALVLIRDRALSSLVGDSENPAHTEWQERSPKFKDRYRHGASTLRYIKNVPRELVRLLTRPSAGRDFTLLKQMFSLESPNDPTVTKHNTMQKPGAGAPSEVESPDTVGKDARFILQKLRGGFRVRGHAEGAPVSAVVVTVAYEVRRGNPFRQYHALDFDLAKLEVSTKGAEVAARKGNVLYLRTQVPLFELSVRGFDPHRDLRVKVLPASEVAA
jgi:hypothetical protein